MPPILGNVLFNGDNLKVLREYFDDECVDLIYLDPPFNSKRDYNVLFRDEHGLDAESQVKAFVDTWHWDYNADGLFHYLKREAPHTISKMIESMHGFIGSNQMMAYLVMMTARLVELHRVLKPTGSLYLHCDSTASHYLKLILDTIFGPENFRNEIVWKRTSAHSDARVRFGDVTDTILFYSKTERATWNPLVVPLALQHVEAKYTLVDEEGRRFTTRDLRSPSPRPNLTYDYKGYQPHPNGWSISREKMEQYDKAGRLWFPRDPGGRIRLKLYLDESQGQPLQNLWEDIPPINSQARERLGYPTQKPLALLERIISASSNPGDLVLDPFCGCGTAIAAAQKLGRRWAGIDITYLATNLIKGRIREMFPGVQFESIGEPESLGDARDLARRQPYQFQWWALDLVGARPYGGTASSSKRGKKGADRGIDGVIRFEEDDSGAGKYVMVQVKGGENIKSGDIRDLRGVIEREGAPIGVFITLEPPSPHMHQEAVAAGMYTSPGWNRDYPRLQILTIEQLLHGAAVKMPPQHGTYRQAERVSFVPTQYELDV